MDKKKFNGTVTKFIDNFGFIDDDVFFRTDVVEGGQVKIHDQVYVECEYSEQLPFKWNATKVKLLNSMQNRGGQQPAPTYLQHRMQQMLQQNNQPPNLNQNLNQNINQSLNQNLNLLAAQQALPNITPDLRKLIEKQQPQQQQQMQNFQQQNNQPPPFNPRGQNDYNQQQPAPFTGQITYTSQPGSAFISPVLQFNQGMNVPPQQQTLPMAGINLRPFHQTNNQGGNNNYPKRDNRPKDRDNRDRDRRKDDRDQRNSRDNDNKRLSRDRDNRDRKAGLGGRDNRDNSVRDRNRNTVSPSNSVTSSSNNTSKPRRRYTPLNIPTHEILKTPLNSYEIKRKFDSSIHIPSDFKELRLNEGFELNLKTLYKPIQYRIVHSVSEEESEKKDDKKESEKKDESNDLKKENEKSESNDTKPSDKSNDKSNDKSSEKSSEKSSDTKVSNDKNDKTNEKVNKTQEDTKTEENKVDLSSIKIKKKPSSNSLSSSSGLHKYAVKVLLLSIPSMNDIYDRVIENDRDTKDSYSANSKAYFLHFNKVLSYLCLKNHNDGHSLIGGKFDPKLDGYIDETTPNLIQTAIRCVKQQAGIDLSSCKKWKHMCTFLYNRDDSPFYENVSFEYSNIFIPDIWSLLESTPCIKNENKINLSTSVKPSSDLNSSDSSKIETNGDSFNSLQVNPSNSINDLSSINDSKLMETSSTDVQESSVNNESLLTDDLTKEDDSSIEISKLQELKVTELRARLEELGHKVPKNLKKADLVEKLIVIMKSQSEVIATDDVSSLSKSNEIDHQPKEESVVVEEKMNVSQEEKKTESVKRKLEDDETTTPDVKKVKHEETSSVKVVEKELEAISEDGFIMAYGTNTTTLNVLNLYQALSHSKYDHFELGIVSELLKEALIDHFGNYILSTCYENRHLIKEQDKQQDDLPSKDTLDNNYVLLAFSFFDSCHCGYMIVDDLLKLLSCCGLNFSKRSWTHIFGNNDRIRYRNFKEPTKIYNFLEQSTTTTKTQDSSGKTTETKSSLYSKDGNIYNIDKLINQSEKDEKLIVELKDKLKLVEDQLSNLQTNLNESEAKQKKMSTAFKKQNDEICDYKRDKERIKYRYDESLKLINSTLNNFNDFIKKHEDKTKDVKERDKEHKDSKDTTKDSTKDIKDLSKDTTKDATKDTNKDAKDVKSTKESNPTDEK